MVKKFLYRYRHLELCGMALILKKIVRIQDIRKSMDHGQIVTYRFAVLGLLLNNEALDRKPPVIH